MEKKKEKKNEMLLAWDQRYVWCGEEINLCCLYKCNFEGDSTSAVCVQTKFSEIALPNVFCFAWWFSVKFSVFLEWRFEIVLEFK